MTLRPTTRLAYCTGMRRWDCSTKTTSAMTSTMIASTTMNLLTPPLPPAIDHMFEGNRAAIEVKISRDMPLPTPRSVISSPSHMIRPVPAVMVITITSMVTQLLFGITGCVHPWNRLPERATAMIVVDCRIARPMVRYRVYCVSRDWPAWPSW